MGSVRRVARGQRRPEAQQGLVIAAFSLAAAAGLSVTQRLIRQRMAVQQRRYRIDAGRGADREVRRVAAGQLERALDELNGRPDDAEAVHQARKALKRSRAVLRVSRHLLGQEVYQHENRSLRDAGRLLSNTRAQQVLAETVDSLSEHADGSEPYRAVQRLRTAVSGDAGPTGGAEQTAARAAVSRTRAHAPQWPLPADGDLSSLGPGLRRIYKQGRRALANVEKKATDERWHEVRKRSKDLRYASELLAAARPKRMKRVRKRARRVSDLLGEDHDLAVLAERIREAPLGRDDAKLLRRLVGRRREELQEEARRVARRLYRRKPGKFIRRLGLP